MKSTRELKERELEFNGTKTALKSSLRCTLLQNGEDQEVILFEVPTNYAAAFKRMEDNKLWKIVTSNEIGRKSQIIIRQATAKCREFQCTCGNVSSLVKTEGIVTWQKRKSISEKLYV